MRCDTWKAVWGTAKNHFFSITFSSIQLVADSSKIDEVRRSYVQDEAIELTSDRATGRLIDRAIARSSDRATELSRDRAIEV